MTDFGHTAQALHRDERVWQAIKPPGGCLRIRVRPLQRQDLAEIGAKGQGVITRVRRGIEQCSGISLQTLGMRVEPGQEVGE